MGEFRPTIYKLVNRGAEYTLTQLAFLMRIAEMKKPDQRSYAALCEFLKVGKSTPTRALQRLMSDGLVERKQDRKDRRTCWYDVSEKGGELAKQLTTGALAVSE